MTDYKVIVIDDDARLLKAYAVSLKRAGFKVITLDDPEKVIITLRDEHPDIVLLDVLMPKKNGWDILREIKSEQKIQDIPVVLVSNIGSTDKEVEALEAGAAAYLVKSDTPLAEVIERIHSILKKN